MLDEGIRYQIITVDPVLALRWLEASEGNRGVVQAHVDTLAGAITTGQWMLNGEAITIDTAGNVVNGQHRLLAVIQCGIAIQTAVCSGVQPTAVKTIDTGRLRSGGDVLKMAYGADITKRLSKTLATACKWSRVIDSGSWSGWNAAITNPDLLAYERKHPQLRGCCEILKSYPADASPMPVGSTAAMYYHFLLRDEIDAEAFMRRFFTGTQLDAKDAEFILRAKLQRDARRQSKYPTSTKLRMLLNAWNIHRDEKRKATSVGISVSAKDSGAIHIA